jgi:phosphoribosyl 1,2-cyclic phosphate phosphodiesterase
MNNIFIKILGCGASSGCPILGCECEVCKSKNSKNNRTRTSLYIKFNNTNILIDSGPDFRFQMLRENISHIDKILYTHKHLDHIAGMDDLRACFFHKKSLLDIYGNYDTLKHCYNNFQYLFKTIDYYNQGEKFFFETDNDFPKKILSGHIISNNEEISIDGLKIQSFLQHHGKIDNLGYLLPHYNFAYSTDLHDLPEQSLNLLKKTKLKTWILSLTLIEGNNAHISLEKIKLYNQIVKPEKIIFTHMGHFIDYDDRSYLEPNMFFGYDGMII